MLGFGRWQRADGHPAAATLWLWAIAQQRTIGIPQMAWFVLLCSVVARAYPLRGNLPNEVDYCAAPREQAGAGAMESEEALAWLDCD